MGYAERKNKARRDAATAARVEHLMTAPDFELSLADKRERDKLTVREETPDNEQHFCCSKCYPVEARLKGWPKESDIPGDAKVVLGQNDSRLAEWPDETAARCCFCGVVFDTAARVKANPEALLCKGKLYRHA